MYQKDSFFDHGAWLGIAFVFIGAVISFWAGYQHTKRIQRLKSGLTLTESSWSMGRFVSVLLALLGAVMTAYLIFLRTL